MTRRLVVSVVIGVAAALLCLRYQVSFNRGAGDLAWPRCGALALLHGNDPYGCPHLMSDGSPGPTNPLPAALAVLPLVWLPAYWLAAVFLGLSSALLAWGLTRDDQWWRLGVFGALPYWHALMTVQWSPLLLAVGLLPVLAPLCLVKPHIGAVVLLGRFSWRAVAGCALFGLISLLVLPDWPLRWLGQVSSYDGFVPLLTWAGPPLLLAGLRWRDVRARWIVLLAVAPQRLWYDQLLVFWIATSPRELLVLIAGSWLGYLVTPALGPAGLVACLYWPALLLVLGPIAARMPALRESRL